MKTLTLKEIAKSLKINDSKSVQIEGLDYFYYSKKNADKECIVAYYKSELRYTYTDVVSFFEEHGIENISELSN